ncbi:heptaprenyl diphosphate synthase [Eubacterium ruminantium]|uniref:Heptaprenyl diphosphate synthase n=1 Tax=Eubacterium ruminantium TaxID=42322 RepID=A0A1T4PIB1_9FIRM|nr:Gx transporter family protein [Eubacterium ruminantium]SCW60172.1 heptaprenyl diphosphate synthase [Eubacterium ruminantium]SDN11420.1 heptaprenyl diphosphate synthase [Eubacterium ruminantium]SJZ91305.1 heptaprenyl diphosphate synthase [Eubacterium ruminantium]
MGESESSKPTLSKNKKIAYRGALIALAMVLSYIESFIPVFAAVPGVRIGLSNIVTVYSLYKLGLRDTIFIALARIVLSSLLFGNPVMIIYSAAGFIFAVIVMYLAMKLPIFGKTGVSVIGGIFHNLGQILVAAFMIGNMSLLYYLGVLLAVGAISGMIVGIISGIVIEKI